MEKGLMHVYCGDGKGKTTAAVGLAVRAAGAGKRVLFTQFMKGGKTAELKSLQTLENITVLRSEKKFPFYRDMTSEQKSEQTCIHNQILNTIAEALQKDRYDLIVLDEVTYPYSWELLDGRRLREILVSARGRTELVCTGRNPDAIFLECADYITEMKCVRHPFEKGVTAREGIEY